jgi:hypothetical protein
MGGTMRSPRLPAVALLLLCALPSRADAQQFVCWPIAAGDTASSLARRLTGNAEGAYSLAFQIRDPARRMFVPKSHYLRLQSAWQACVARGTVPKTQVVYAPVVELAASAMVPGQPIEPTAQALASAPLTLARPPRTLADVPLPATIAAGLLMLIVLFSTVAGSVTLRPIPPSVRRAGEHFVTVFARPLIDGSSGVPPVQTRLRFVRRKQQLEIFLAPGPGHRYPNLTDHKKNVEYDVDRVIRVLRNYVLSRPPRAAGKWVVVTIEPRELHEQGVANTARFGSVLFRGSK